MRRSVLFVLIVLLTAAGLTFAEEATLINFSELTANYPADNPVHDQETLVDYSAAAGSSYSEEAKDEMKISLAIGSWEIDLASSSQNVVTTENSMVREAPVIEDASQFAGETVMGARVRFPEEPFNSWALIRPPFEIPSYADVDEIQTNDEGRDILVVPQEEAGRGRKFDNIGVVKNVGVLRSISMTVYGLNYPHGISIVLQDENNEQHEIFMGYMAFDGWRTLEWRNPNYITEVRNRELRTFPLYPQSAPMRKLIGIRVYKDAAMQGGDFIAYIKEINLTYDRALVQLERDIDDESVWGILQERERSRREAELQRLGRLQVLRYLEQRKMHDPNADQGQNADGGGNGGGE